MASTSKRSQEHELAVGFKKVRVTILASEWGSSKGVLSTISRELAVQLAKLPEVEITLFLLRCSEEDKNQALLSNVKIVEATRHPGFDELDWLSFPPEHLQIDVIVGHGVKLGHQVQVIKKSKKCKWVQVVHTDPEEQEMFKSYSKPISKGQEKHRTEVELCEMADLVVGIGPKLSEAFRSYLRSCHKDQNVVDFTPGLFDEFKSVKQSPEERKHCSILVFGREDDEDFELKGFDIAARAVAPLRDTRLVFVGTPDGKHEEIKEKLTGCGVPARNLRVRGFVQSREDLKRLFLEVDLVLVPSRTEGFGLTGLEALSAGVPVLVSSNSGFGEALSKVPFGSSFVIDSEDPEEWTAAIKKVWGKDRQWRLEEAEMVRTSYERKYNWANQSRDLLGKMISLLNGKSDINTSQRERFAGAGPREVSLQDALTVKLLKLDDQRRVQEGLTEVEAERQNSAVHQISYEIANCESDIAFFGGRHHKDTRQWLFDDFDKWFSDPGDSRAYVLLGDAGVGKSVIAGVLAQRMKKARRLGAAYFCRHYDGTRNDPRNLLGTIACQLCNCNSQYSNKMGGEDGVRIMLANSNLGVQELCTKLLEEPLSRCSPFQRKLVIIDALDETEYKSRKDFICLIKERFPRLPEWLVFFITSRPEDMLQNRLAKYNPCVRICAGNGEQRTLYYQQHEQDIQRFLEKSVNFSRLPCSVQDVTRRCNGLFLYAFYIAQELNDSLHSGKIDQLCDLFPGDIEDFFETNLKRVCDKVGEDLYRKLLGCIMNAPSPLPVSFVSFVLHRENSSLNEQKVIDAVSQFVVMQKRVSFLHSLIPAWLTNKKKAQELYIDPKEAGGYLTEIVKEILSAFVGQPRLDLDHVERDLQSFSLHFAVHMLCQHAQKDSLELVFRCLTSYRFLEERISSGRFGIYHLLKDFQRAVSCLAVKQRKKQNILQEISVAIESDVHVLVESPHLLRSCIRNSSDVVQENILIPQGSSPWFDLNVYDCPHTVEVLPSCNCFAKPSDKQTVYGGKGRLLFLFNPSVPHVVSGPVEIREGRIVRYINNLKCSAHGSKLFVGRLDKWFSVERGSVENLPQFLEHCSHYHWSVLTSVLTPDGCYIVVELKNECDSTGRCYIRWSGFPPAQLRHVTTKCVLSPDGKFIALLQQTKVTLHRVESEGFCCTVFDAEFGIMDAWLKFSTDGSLLFVCMQDSLKGPHFYVWDIRKRAMSHSFKSPGLLLTVDCFCISSDMSYLILCGGYNEIEVCEFKNLKDPFRFLQSVGVEKFYNSVKFSLCIVSQDNELLVCCIANLIYVYKLTVANIYSSRQILRGHLGKIEFCRFLNGKRFLISYGVDGMVFLWNIPESKAIGFARIAQGDEKIVFMAVLPEEDRAVCFLSSIRVCEITVSKLECALSSKLLTALTEGKLDSPETKTQLAEHMPSTSNIPTSSLEDYKSEPSWNSDFEEDFYIPENYFFESDESDI